MLTRVMLATAAWIALAAGPGIATAGSYTVNCGAGGSSALIQSQLAAIAGTTGNTLTVTGSCTGSLFISNVSQLQIDNLTLTGDLGVNSSQNVSFSNLTLTGNLSVSESRGTRFTGPSVTGWVQTINGSSVAFNQVTLNPGFDSTGQLAQGFVCAGQSQCSLTAATLHGAHAVGPAAPSLGALAASGSTLTLFSGSISGFDVGLQAWNHATALLVPTCDTLSITGNGTMGVYIRDSGLAKLYSATPVTASGTCPGRVSISGNGSYGLLAEGGGNAYLYGVQISGHSIDGIRVQDGSSVKVLSSTVDAATMTGRSARVRTQALLWFNEEANGPAAKSVFAGPVCVTGNSSTDTNNSSTVLTVHTSCTGP